MEIKFLLSLSLSRLNIKKQNNNNNNIVAKKQ